MTADRPGVRPVVGMGTHPQDCASEPGAEKYTGAGGVGEFFHVGLVVDNVRETVALFENALGLRFTPVMQVTHLQWTRARGLQRRVRQVSFSAQPPYLELQEFVPNTYWGRTGLHHCSYWVADVAAVGRRLEEQGFELCIRSYPALDSTVPPTTVSYRHSSNELFVELADSVARQAFTDMIKG